MKPSKKPSVNVGEDNANAKLNVKEVAEIRKYLMLGYSQKGLARLFGVAPPTVHKIQCGTTWKNVEAAK